VQPATISAGAAPQPATGAKKPNLMEMLNTSSTQTPANIGYGQPQQQAGYGMGGMGMGMGGNLGAGAGGMGIMGMNMGGHRQTPSLSSNPSQFPSPMPQLQPQQPNLFGGGSAPMRPTTMGGSQTSMSNSSAKPPAAVQAKSANFDDLWSMSLGGGSSSSPNPAATTAGKSIKDLEKEKAMAGIWGGTQQKPVGGAAPAFGGFGNAAPPTSSGAGDDLLL